MANPIFAAIVDESTKKMVIFDLLTSTTSITEDQAVIVTGQGVKLRTQAQVVVALFQANDIAVAQMVRNEAPVAETEAEVKGAANAEV